MASSDRLTPAPPELQPLLQEYAASGAAYSVHRFAEMLEESLTNAADPLLAVANLRRVLEAALNRTAVCNDLVRSPWLMDRLVRIVGVSGHFADIIVREPEILTWLGGDGVSDRTDTRTRIARDVARALSLFSRPERVLDSLKRIQRREIFRTGARDLLGIADFGTVVAEISALADALIAGAWELSRRVQREKTGAEPVTPSAVIALGKLGGAELNYSSDVDLMIVYGKEGTLRTAAGGELTHQEYFNRVTERFIAGLTGVTAEGHLYRVDLRLRPEGAAGPLARALSGTILYYETRGQQWERQMLLKARVVAGDAGLGTTLLERLTPFIHPRTQFRHPSEEIARMKARIEASLGDDRNVKLARGGIRDIEFVVQALQLIHGGRCPAVRTGNTLAGIEHLAGQGFLNPVERETLRESYLFLRSVEHLLQIRQNTQTHTLPDESRPMHVLARALGMQEGDRLRERVVATQMEVRTVYAGVMQAPRPGPEDELAALLEGAMPEGLLKRLLGRYGFRDAGRAVRLLESFLSGKEGESGPREDFRRMAGETLQELGRTHDPDEALTNLVLLLSSGRAGESLQRQVAVPGFRRLLLKICGSGPRLARSLVRYPLILEELALAPASGGTAVRSGVHSIAAMKEEGETRLLARYVLGTAAAGEVFAGLADLTDRAVQLCHAAALRARKRKGAPLLIVALGKYGSRERGVDADLDLMFLAGGARGDALHRLELLAADVVGRLSEVTEEGGGFDVDARLRPEGKSAPLVADLSSFATYLRTRASLWERQALTRARVVAGDPALAVRAREIIQEFVYGAPLPRGWAREILEMRRKTERRSRMAGPAPVDLKFGAGGLLDVEFLAQMLLLACGPEGAAYQARPVPEILVGRPGEILAAPDRRRLQEWYAFLRTLELLMRISLDDRSSLLPEGHRLDRLAAGLGLAGPDLAARCREQAADIRRMLLAATTTLDSLSGNPT